MNIDLLQALTSCETDIDGTLDRFGGNEALYVKCLAEFLSDSTMAELDTALHARSWDDAFTAAHALKGLAGNMGFIPLYHSLSEMVVLIRAGRVKELDMAIAKVKHEYNAITGVIRQAFIRQLTKKESQV